MEEQQLKNQSIKNYTNRYKKLSIVSFVIAMLLLIFRLWVSYLNEGLLCPDFSCWVSYDLPYIVSDFLTILWIFRPYIIIILIVIAVVSLILHYNKKKKART